MVSKLPALEFVALNLPDESTDLTFRTYLKNYYVDPVSALSQNARHQRIPGLQLF